MLLAKNAKTGIKSKQQRLPLHEAAHYAPLSSFKLLEAKTFVDSTGILHLSTLNPDSSVLKYLMASKPDSSLTTPYPHPPYGSVLHFAARGGTEETLKQLLLRTTSLSPLDKEGRTPLHVAVRAKHYAAVRVLLEAGASAYEKDTFGVSVFDEVKALNDQRMADLVNKRAPGQVNLG